MNILSANKRLCTKYRLIFYCKGANATRRSTRLFIWFFSSPPAPSHLFPNLLVIINFFVNIIPYHKKMKCNLVIKNQSLFSTQPNLKDKKIRSLFSWNENELRILLKVFVKG